jgi:PAT family beta-lactamase induction signal transducer AmpG
MNRTVRAYLNVRMLVVALQGFSGGLPLALTGTTLQAWMKDEKIDLALIGLYSLVGLPYSFKFVWSPILDRFSFPFLGHRRGWLLASQLALAAGIAGMGLCHPAAAPLALATIALFVAFASASQDIVIDAYRVDALAVEEYGAGLSLYTVGYRLAMIVSGAVALGMADHVPWRVVYLAMSATMVVGVLSTLIAPEPPRPERPPRTLAQVVVEPLAEFFRRRGSIEILIFILIYKLDTFLSIAIMTPFFLDLGFTKTEIAAVTKLFGMLATIAGGLVGGAVLTRWTILRSLVVFGFLQAVASLSFLSLAVAGKNHWMLIATIGIENFCSGLGIAALTAFMMSLVNKRFTATQYALLSSLTALTRYITSAPAGYLQHAVGWQGYYVICAIIGAPGLMLLSRYHLWNKTAAPEPPSPARADGAGQQAG